MPKLEIEVTEKQLAEYNSGGPICVKRLSIIAVNEKGDVCLIHSPNISRDGTVRGHYEIVRVGPKDTVFSDNPRVGVQRGPGLFDHYWTTTKVTA